MTDKNSKNSLPLQPLSLREKEVLIQCCKGRSNKAIASALGISEKTVEFHFTSIFKKLNVHSRTSAVLEAIKLQLIDH